MHTVALGAVTAASATVHCETPLLNLTPVTAHCQNQFLWLLKLCFNLRRFYLHLRIPRQLFPGLALLQLGCLLWYCPYQFQLIIWGLGMTNKAFAFNSSVNIPPQTLSNTLFLETASWLLPLHADVVHVTRWWNTILSKSLHTISYQPLVKHAVLDMISNCMLLSF